VGLIVAALLRLFPMLLVSLCLLLPAQEGPSHLRDLAKMNDCQLAELFARGTVPECLASMKTRGRVFTKPGCLSSRLLGVSLWPLWHGKQIDMECGVMRNRLPGGLEVVPAAVEIRPSLADGDPAVIFDYKGMQKKATQFAEVAFDEVRQVHDGLWLGRMWLRQKDGSAVPSAWFGLQEVR